MAHDMAQHMSQEDAKPLGRDAQDFRRTATSRTPAKRPIKGMPPEKPKERQSAVHEAQQNSVTSVLITKLRNRTNQNTAQLDYKKDKASESKLIPLKCLKRHFIETNDRIRASTNKKVRLYA